MLSEMASVSRGPEPTPALKDNLTAIGETNTEIGSDDRKWINIAGT
jgi:hypothetical protein